jgi:SAM-dependent methyltransferase
MMDESPRYGAWIANAIKTHLRGQLLEVGCGSGHYSPSYAQIEGVRTVTAIDLDPNLIAQARRDVIDPSIDFCVQDASKLSEESYESIVCANVLEHIEDDLEFLTALSRALVVGGSMVVLVPAHPFLYAECDREAGHYRRYRRRDLGSLIAQTDLTLDRLFFFNLLGALGWLYAFKIRQRSGVRETDSRAMISFFDRFVLPVGRSLESVVPIPFGLSLIALCSRRR